MAQKPKPQIEGPIYTRPRPYPRIRKPPPRRPK